MLMFFQKSRCNKNIFEVINFVHVTFLCFRSTEWIFVLSIFKRLARTVIFGGLLSADMAERVHHKAKECGTVSSIIYPLSRDELNHHGIDIFYINVF